MNILFLSPHFPPSYRAFCQALRSRGARVLGIGDVPAAELGDLGPVLTDYVHVPQMSDDEAMVRAVGLLISRHGRIQHLDSLNEHWLPLEAKLREDFNVPGMRPKDLARCRSKFGMAEIFRENGIDAPETIRVHTPAELRAFADKVGFPIILKPDVGVGADRTFRIEDADALARAAAQLSGDFVAQPFVQGTMTTFDGLTDHDGNILFAISFVYARGLLEMIGARTEVAYWSRRGIPPALDALGRRVVRAFDLRGRFFHGEYFEREDGSFVPLELNLRPPGGYTLDLMNYACDVDLYGLWADVVTGRSTTQFGYEPRYHAAHVGRRNEEYRLGVPEAKAVLGSALMSMPPVPRLFGETMGDPIFLIRHAEEAELRTTMDQLLARR